MTRKILFVGMQSSPHFARWIQLVADRGWDLHVFPVDGCLPNRNLEGVTLHWPVLDSALEPVSRPLVETPRLPKAWSLASRLKRIGRLAMNDPAEVWYRLKARLEAARAPHASAPGRPSPVIVETEGGLPVEATTKETAREFSLRWLRFTPTLAELGGERVLKAGTVRLGESECTAPVLNGPGVLAERIRTLRPDLIHSMEFQHCGYLVLRARELYGPGFPTWLATNWGSDIFYFGRFADHRAQIERLLSVIDFYSCECERDIALARQFGYRGPAFSGIPNSGGFDLKQVASLRSPQPPSKRKVVMIKGYQHFAGRAMTALKVLETLAPKLNGYRIVLFSVSEEPRRRANELKRDGILNTEVIDWATHEKILTLFGEARLYMGISISDAISTSALEAMTMGAFPIQTNTSCCDEWFRDGEGGFIVPPDAFDVICEKFERALTDDVLVDRAAEINWETVRMRLDKTLLAPKVASFYDRIFTTVQKDSCNFAVLS